MKNPTAPILLLALLSSPACTSPALQMRSLPVTAQEQARFSPDAVIADLTEGNRRYVEGRLLARNVKAQIAASREGQFPKAVILSCLDSRVPVEQVFDQGIGDVFVGRVAGNVDNVDQLGSTEFAARLSGVRLVLVLGHESCGAVKGACDGAQLGNLTELLEKIHPAIDSVQDVPEKERNSKNAAFVERVVEENVRQTVADIRARSSILAEMELAGDLRIVGAIYSLKTGRVRWLAPR